MTDSAGPFEWHYIGRFGQLGPLSLDQLRELCRDEVVGPETYVWKNGMADWVRLGSVPELASALPSHAVPPTPPAPPGQRPIEPTIPSSPPRHDFVDLVSPVQPVAPGYWASAPAPYYLSDRSRVLAGVLNLVLPGVGRLYLGYTTVGILQLLTGWLCGVGFIWSIVDGILILTGSTTVDAQGRTLRS